MEVENHEDVQEQLGGQVDFTHAQPAAAAARPSRAWRCATACG